MSDQQRQFTSALRFSFLTPVYDLAIRLFTREKAWRNALIKLLDVSSSDRILDVGCGTGSLAIALKQAIPDCHVIGLDPDPRVLAIAKKKARTAGVLVEWKEGFLDEFSKSDKVASMDQCDSSACQDAASISNLAAIHHEKTADLLPESLDGVTKVVSSLVLHQTSLEAKRSIFRSAFDLLPEGGTFSIADYGVQRSFAMKLMFKLIVQSIDGKEDTQPNANGFLIEGLKEAGFCQVREVNAYSTLTGSISLISARKPHSN